MLDRYLDSWELIQIDISPEMLQHASGDRICGVANHLPFSENSFDTIASRSVFHHLPDLETATNEIYRVLRPGGIFIAVYEPTPGGKTLRERVEHRIRSWISQNVLGRSVPRWLEYANREFNQYSNPDRLVALANIHSTSGLDLTPFQSTFDDVAVPKYQSSDSFYLAVIARKMHE